MKRGKWLLPMIVAIVATGLQVNAADMVYTEDQVESVCYELPEELFEDVNEGELNKTYEGNGYFVGVVYTPVELNDIPEDLQVMLLDATWATMEENEGYEQFDSVYGIYQDSYSINARFVSLDISGSKYEMFTYAAWCGDGIAMITAEVPVGSETSTTDECLRIYEHIGETLHTADWIEEPTGLTFEEELDFEKNKSMPEVNSAGSFENNSKSASIGEENALKQAKSYLNYTAFSYTGLIGQLEYEGYSHEEAVYGADHCGADWNEQAAKQAKSYLSYTSFSRSSLIEQLEYEGYTHEQAEYGSDNCGNDWDGSKTGVSAGMTNALSQAKSYLNYSSFSYSGLIEQLEFEGYSHDEAVYGVDNCGADWNEQAAKTAESYVRYSSFSRSELIEQLEYEGFTHEQAEYGVTTVGY